MPRIEVTGSRKIGEAVAKVSGIGRNVPTFRSTAAENIGKQAAQTRESRDGA